MLTCSRRRWRLAREVVLILRRSGVQRLYVIIVVSQFELQALLHHHLTVLQRFRVVAARRHIRQGRLARLCGDGRRVITDDFFLVGLGMESDCYRCCARLNGVDCFGHCWLIHFHYHSQLRRFEIEVGTADYQRVTLSIRTIVFFSTRKAFEPFSLENAF